MSAAIQKRLALLEAVRAPDERLTVIVRRLADGPRRGEPTRVSDLLMGRTWQRTNDESATAFAKRIEAEGGPRLAAKKDDEARKERVNTGNAGGAVK